MTTGGLAVTAGSATAQETSHQRTTAGPLAGPLTEAKKTRCYTRPTPSITAGCAKSKKIRTFAWFDPDGDDVSVLDHYSNGRSTKVLLKVEGYKVRTYSSKGKTMRVINQNFRENRMVRIKACTSFSKKAKCSGWSRWSFT
ncbi:hypothetical protein E0L36_18940 [Streptomyces sp. AJS327]|nr:hypothetical protein [Streptomyces sp. AJS327]